VAKYRILIKASAAKEIERLPTRKDRRRVVEKIRKLADNPRPKGCEKLSGQDHYRVRQGNHRIIYSIADDRLVVHVVKVGDRKDVYRN
jgi:mRNA interferase RelE/StbE